MEEKEYQFRMHVPLESIPESPRPEWANLDDLISNVSLIGYRCNFIEIYLSRISNSLSIIKSLLIGILGYMTLMPIVKSIVTMFFEAIPK